VKPAAPAAPGKLAESSLRTSSLPD